MVVSNMNMGRNIVAEPVRMPEIQPENEVVKGGGIKGEAVSSTEKTNADNSKSELSDEEKQEKLQELQKMFQTHDVEISFREDVNRYAVKIKDADSEKVIREIPSDKMLDVFAKMLEREGLLVDEKR